MEDETRNQTKSDRKVMMHTHDGEDEAQSQYVPTRALDWIVNTIRNLEDKIHCYDFLDLAWNFGTLLPVDQVRSS